MYYPGEDPAMLNPYHANHHHHQDFLDGWNEAKLKQESADREAEMLNGMDIPKEIYVIPDMPGRYFESWAAVAFAADRKYILATEHTALLERHRRLIEAAKGMLNAVTVLCVDEYSCFSTCVLANECDKDSGNECLWVARLRAALEEGEGYKG